MASKPPATPFTAMGQTFDALQQFWGALGMPAPGSLPGMNLAQPMPTMLAPTVDVGELDKRIAELRAVEKWLELNASMLRTTIQTLEVQRATIATLKGFGGAMFAPLMDAAMAPAPRPAAAFEPAPTPAPPAPAPATAAPRSAPRARKVAAPSLADDALNPAAWWQALQDQFGKIASVAADAPAAAPQAKAAPKKKARRRRRPAG